MMMNNPEALKHLLRLVFLHLPSQTPPETSEGMFKTIYLYKHIEVHAAWYN